MLRIGGRLLSGLPLTLSGRGGLPLALGLPSGLVGGLLGGLPATGGLLRGRPQRRQHPVGLGHRGELGPLGGAERPGRVRQRSPAQREGVAQGPVLGGQQLGAPQRPQVAFGRPVLGCGPLAQDLFVLRRGRPRGLLGPCGDLGQLPRRGCGTEGRVQVLPRVQQPAAGFGTRDPPLLVGHVALAEPGQRGAGEIPGGCPGDRRARGDRAVTPTKRRASPSRPTRKASSRVPTPT